MGKQIKLLLVETDKKQVDLVRELLKRGYKVLPSELSKYIGGTIQSAKSNMVMDEVGKILKQWENEKKGN